VSKSNSWHHGTTVRDPHPEAAATRPDPALEPARLITPIDPVTLRPFAASDVPQLVRWLREAHVAPWYRRPEEDVRWATNPPPGGAQAIIARGASGLGYLRWQRVDRATLDRLGLPEVPDNSVDADIVLGEGAVGRGVGPAALRVLATELCRDPAVPLIGLTTELGNARAHRAFARAGFRIARQYEAPVLGRCHLMVLDLRAERGRLRPDNGDRNSSVECQS
jgi:aminoglycoside 6'-N-acetyltransferase